MLSEFQNQCEATLMRALTKAGASVGARSEEGLNETFIRLSLPVAGADMFIYDDEAGIQGPGIDLRFECPDYDSPAKLIDAFVSAAVEILG